MTLNRYDEGMFFSASYLCLSVVIIIIRVLFLAANTGKKQFLLLKIKKSGALSIIAAIRPSISRILLIFDKCYLFLIGSRKIKGSEFHQ